MTPTQILDRTAPLEVHDVPRISLPPMHTSTLSGGAHLKVYDRGHSPIVQLTIVREGGIAELPDPHLNPLYGTMLREGTASYTPEQIADTIDFNGAWLSTSLSLHHTIIKVYTLSKNLPHVLDIVSEIATCPTFDEKILKIQSQSAAKELEHSLRKVRVVAGKRRDKAAMGAYHPLAIDVTPEGIRNLPHELFHTTAKRFAGAPTTIFLAGEITPAVLNSVSSTFRHLDASAPSRLIITPPRFEGPGHNDIAMPGSSQSAVAMALPAIARSHPDYQLLHMTVTALGGYFGSRLMQTIREENGYTYGIRAGLMGHIDGSYIGISAECDSRYVDPLIREVKHQMELMAQHPPMADELSRVRQAIAASLLEVLETPFGISDYHCAMLTQGLMPDYFNRRVELLSALTPEQVATMSERYLRPELLNISVAG